MSRPIVFLSFANAQEKHLPLLDKERQSIVEALRPLEDNDYFSVRHEPSVTRDILSTYLTEYRDRIILFHYAGHAESDKLVATDGSAFAEGLAALLGNMPNLKLVILNGCSTQAQVEQLIKAGVPAVIGTSVPVRDDLAMEFSISFYRSLANGKTIAESYEDARGHALLIRNTVQIPERGIRLRDMPVVQMPWGLFEGDIDQADQWKLPSKVFTPVTIRAGGDVDINFNNSLTQSLFQVLAPYDSYLRFSWEQKQNGEEPPLRVVQQQIIDALPVPLGQEIRRIFSTTELNVERIGLFVRTYRCLLQLLSYTLLAQLWDLLYSKTGHVLADELKSTVRKFLSADEDERTFDDYVNIIKSLRLHFTAEGVSIFIDELTELSNRFNTLPEMQTAHRALENLRARLKSNPDLPQSELVSLNATAEESLGAMFKELGIVCRYKFVTIKDIDLIKKRHTKPEFRIQKVNLDRLTAGLMDELRTEQSFTDNHAVILLKSAKNFEQYLNLSPFLIDEHALIEKMQKSKLYMFSSYEEAANRINYHLVLENVPHAQLDTAVYPVVFNEFMAFRKAVLG